VWLAKSWVQYARTQATDFGWDWSPALAPQGLYGDVQLLAQSLVMEHPIVEQTVQFTSGGEAISAILDVHAQIKLFAKQTQQRIEIIADLTFEG